MPIKNRHRATALILALVACQAWAQNDMVQYTVVKGDTIWTFSNVYLTGKTAWQKVVKINRVVEPKLLQPGTVLKIPKNLLKLSQEKASIESVSGPVTIHPFLKDATAAKVGALLGMNDQIATGRQGYVSLRYPDGSLVTLPSNTTLRIDSMTRSKFKTLNNNQSTVLEGKIDALITKQNKGDLFQLKNNRAIAGVRGTEFRFGQNEGGSSVLEVLDGAVAFGRANGKPKLIQTDQVASLSPQGVLLTQRLPEAPNWDPVSTLQIDPEVHLQVKMNPAEFAQLRVTVAANTAFAQPVFNSVVSPGKINIPDLPGGVWFAKVSGINNNQIEGDSQMLMFDRLVSANGKVPSAVQTSRKGREVPFSWPNIGPASHFELTVSQSENLSSPLYQQTVEQANATVCCLKAGLYYWQVNYRNKQNALVHHGRTHALLIGQLARLPMEAKPTPGDGTNR